MINVRDYVKADLEKNEGLYMPVKASLLEQIFIRKLAPEKLHPNPNDEFSSPTVGPNDQIIDKYIKQIRHHRDHNMDLFDEPLMVEKMRPDGFMLINGHHRWAAALQLGISKIPVRVINATHAADILDQFSRAKYDKRATIDLDEVFFCQDSSEAAEKPLFFPFNRLFPNRIRSGIPSLFYTLMEKGYDVWVYSSGHLSTEYIRELFSHYRIYVTGIINGAERLISGKEMQDIREMMAKRYRVTLNIDKDSISWIQTDSKDFDMIPIEPKGEPWAKAVVSAIRDLKDL